MRKAWNTDEFVLVHSPPEANPVWEASGEYINNTKVRNLHKKIHVYSDTDYIVNSHLLEV